MYDSITGDTAFIRYRAETPDGDYLIAFKFQGDDLDADEENAEIIGIAVCPYDEEPSDDNTVSIGDTRYNGESILVW